MTEKETNYKRNITLFLFGQGLSLFGSMLVQFAMMWHITLTTQSGSAMTLYVIVGLLPTFFMSPFGGVWADRYNRKNLINLADGGIATVTLLIALAFLTGYKELWLIFVCSAVRALGQGIQSPAVGAFIPQITPQEHLSKINGINTSIQSFAALVAPMASGALLTFVPLEIIFFIDIVTAITGICILQFLVKIPQKAVAETGIKSAANYFQDLREGLRYVWQEKFIFQIIILATIMFAVMSPASFLSPLQVVRDFGGDVWRLTAIEIAFSGGMMLGGVLIGFWGGFRNRMYSMSLACVIIGTGIVALGLLNNFWLYSAAMFIIGLTVPLSNTPCMVILQTKVEPVYMGRVFGVFGMTYSLTMPLAMLVFGPLADAVAIDWLLIGSGVVIVLLSVPYVASKVLREVGETKKE
jgi:DHA3 family macrolide efflux protein-like MFS transporter